MSVEPRPTKEDWVAPDGEAVKNVCRACGGDLTPYSLGSLMPNLGVLVISPLECPYCHTAMFYIKPNDVQRILRPAPDLLHFPRHS